jgi:hypothetical protein
LPETLRQKSSGTALKPPSFNRKVEISGDDDFNNPTLSITKVFNVELPLRPNGNLATQHTWMINLKNISLHDFQEKMHKLEVVSSNAVLITMPISSYPKLFGNLLCQEESSLQALKAARNQFASEAVLNEYRILIVFNDCDLENVFPWGKGDKAKFVEPFLAGALLTMKKQVEVKVQVESEPMPDPLSLSSTVLRSPPATRETHIKLVEEDVITDRMCCVSWTVGIKGTRKFLDFYGHEDDDGETAALGEKAGDFCKSMSIEDVTQLKSRRKSRKR